MNIPLQTIHWAWQNYTECGLMAVAVDGSPRWVPLIPLENDPWRDGTVHLNPAHLFQVGETEWEMVRWPEVPWAIPAEPWIPNGPRGRMVRSSN